MTPAQQSALEGLVSRSLTEAEIPLIDVLLPERNDTEIATILSADRVTTRATPIGIGTVLAVMAPSGGEFLNALESLGTSDANVKWSLKMIEQATFDVGHPVTRLQLQDFALAVPGMAQAIYALMAVAEVNDPIHYNAVSNVLNIAEGRMTL